MVNKLMVVKLNYMNRIIPAEAMAPSEILQPIN